MTPQITEVIHYQGRRYALHTEPLTTYFRSQNIDPGFEPPNSSLWRGYQGTWEIRDNRLYLIGLRAYLMDGSEADLVTLCPVDAASPVGEAFAVWYSGSLCLREEDSAESTDTAEIAHRPGTRIIDVLHGEVVTGRTSQD